MAIDIEEVDLALTLIPDENGNERLTDQTTRSLLNQLRDSDIHAELATSAHRPPGGAKSGVWIEIGSILLKLAPAVIPKLIDLIQSFVTRKNGRTLTLTLSNGVALTVNANTPPEKITALVAAANAPNLKTDS